MGGDGGVRTLSHSALGCVTFFFLLLLLIFSHMLQRRGLGRARRTHLGGKLFFTDISRGSHG